MLFAKGIRPKEYLWLKLNPDITGFHIVSYLIMCFTLYLIIQFIVSFLIYILQSPDYYNVPDDQVGTITGDCGFYAEITVVMLDMILGVIFDTVGRKAPVVIGFIVCGLSIGATPFFHQVYP